MWLYSSGLREHSAKVLFHWFESNQSLQTIYVELAQLEEHHPYKLGVGSSSLSFHTNMPFVANIRWVRDILSAL